MKKVISVVFLFLMAIVSFNASAQYPRGDVNQDGQVSIADVSALIDYLLEGTWPAPPTTKTFTVNGVSFTMVMVEGGTFMMGGTEEQEPDAVSWERPVHEVTLSDYSIGQTEVTQALWKAVMGTNPSTFNDDPNRPVERVNVYDCENFIQTLNELTGMKFRLPTEAEWEYAARGGNKSMGYKYSGSNDLNEVAWYDGNAQDIPYDDPNYGPHPVGSVQPNELGIYDMSGNVNEWCQDWWDYYSADPQVNPTGPEQPNSDMDARMIRGGSWKHPATDCRVSMRYGYRGTERDNSQGFRLAL